MEEKLEESSRKPKRKLKKTKIIAIIGIILSIIVIISLLSVNSRPYLKVSQVSSKPSKYDNKEIQVIGIVLDFSGENFSLTENEYSIFVDINDLDVPNEFENGVQVVITGIFNAPASILTASQILTQCS